MIRGRATFATGVGPWMALDLDGTAFEPNTLQPSLKTIPKGGGRLT
jgi:hypothetical protein